MARKGTLEITLVGETKPFEDAMGKATGILETFATGAVGILAGLGLAGGAALVGSFVEALERDALNDKLAAQLGATPQEAEKYGEIAGRLWADAYGDSIEQVNEAIGAVVSSLGELSDAEIESLTAHALNFAETFDVEVTQSVTAASTLLKTGLAKDGEEAFDLLVAAAQQLPAEMRDEIFPLIDEYSTFLADLGLSGEEAFGIIVSASDEGRMAMDRTLDALKELTIRATEESTPAIREAFDELGLSADQMADDFLTGGDTARDAMDRIIDALLDVKDPSKQAELAVELFGTPIEDLSKKKIPDFLRSLDDTNEKFGETEGKAKSLDQTLNENVATRFTQVKRTVQQEFVDWAGRELLPMAEDILEAFDEGGVGGALDKAIELWEEAQPRIERWWNRTFVPFFEDTVAPAMGAVGRTIGREVVAGIWAGVEAAIPSFFTWLYGRIADEQGPIERAANNVFPNTPRVPSGSTVPRPSRSGGGGGGFTRMHFGGEVMPSTPGWMPGLSPNERHTVLEIGEEVLTASDPRHSRNMGTRNYGGAVTLTDESIMRLADAIMRRPVMLDGQKVSDNVAGRILGETHAGAY